MFVELIASLALLVSGPLEQREPLAIPALPPPEGEFEDDSAERGMIRPREWLALCKPWDDWDKPAPPFMIAPHLYYVGTCGISSLLVVTPGGYVLIDSGTEGGAEVVLANIRRAGFDPERINLILTSHEHFDHVGGLHVIQKVSRAPVVALPAAAETLRTGLATPSDPQAGMHDAMVPVLNVIEVESDRPVRFGGIDFTPIATPGHTPGATTWQWENCFGQVCRWIVYADSLSAVSRDDYRFSDHPDYLQAYRDGIARLAAIDCDLLLTPHPSSSFMLQRMENRDTLDEEYDCAQYASDIERRLNARLEREAATGE